MSNDIASQEAPVLAANPRRWSLWAKWSDASQSPATYHPVICHLIDVAQVARLLWDTIYARPHRERLADAFQLDQPTTAAWVAFFAGLHDLGKASPAFQTQLGLPLVEEWLRSAGLRFPNATWAPHGLISAIALEDVLPQRFGLEVSLTQQIACVVGGHHGVFPTPAQLRDISSAQLGDAAWDALRADLVQALACALRVPEQAPRGPLSNADAMALAGFVSVADWIGSNEQYFRHAGQYAHSPAPMALDEYATLSRLRAAEAVQALHWDAWDLTGQPRTFTQLFPGRSPRPAQDAIINLAKTLDGPALAILEVPMGEGKTEAAMCLADHWATVSGQHGIYFALPTQATSNQMFTRVREFLQQRFADGSFVNLQLAHGFAALSDEYAELRAQGRHLFMPADVYDGDNDNRSHDPVHGAVIAAEWFAAPKRALLSSFGVGTVDQALFAVLQVKHGFVRLFGLGNKTVIVDEVHAYDTYMSTLLGRLLEWLGALGAPTVLLSATLPRNKRRELLSRYAHGAGWPVHSGVERPYPCLSWISSSGPGAEHIAMSTTSRSLALRRVDGKLPRQDEDAFALGEELAKALRDGGCAAVICNTVNRAQRMYTALRRYFPGMADDGRPELDLLHARFLYGERQLREKRVLSRFGKGDDTHRPRRAVLVATQVIEQSLDLDFDLMISDLAPVDLLLQRSGRLHRHVENDAQRPPALRRPTLWISQPAVDEHGIPTFERGDAAVYEPHILLRTWLTLQERAAVRMPEDIEELIEAVYDHSRMCPTDASDALCACWEHTLAEARKEAHVAEAKARRCYIASPGDETLFTMPSLELDEDNPRAHETIQAATRDGDPSVQVVVLDERAAATFKRSAVPTLADAKALLSQSVSITRKGLVQLLVDEEPPSGWTRTPWLRHHRLVALDSNGSATVGGRYVIHLDPDLGIVIRDIRREEQSA